MADGVLALHFAVVLFVVGGQLAILTGWAVGWTWTRNLYFRFVHLAGMLLVALQAWLGAACPLTLLENYLRKQAGSTGYQRGFISEWISRLLFYTAPDWVFTLVYTLFALLVGISYLLYPPRR